MYATLKFIHVSSAVLTLAGFVLRGYWMLSGSGLLARRSVRIAPHVIDTVFLLSGIGLILQMRLQVLQNDWLLIKFAALLAYILLGAVALTRGRTRSIRLSAFVLALLTFGYIAGVALGKSAASWLSFIR